MAVVLVGLNAASYTQTPKRPDSESAPNRSTYNAGPTGTRAFYSLLSETGRKVVHWQESTDVLETRRKDVPSTFVIIGPLRRDFSDSEETALLSWVSSGGRLVVIDRDPPEPLTTTTANWKITLKKQNELQQGDVDPGDPQQMTAQTAAAKPVQPSIFTAGVNAVQASKFASSIVFEPFSGNGVEGDKKPTTPKKLKLADPPPPTEKKEVFKGDQDNSSQRPPPPRVAKSGNTFTITTPTPVPIEEFKLDVSKSEPVNTPSLFAPVVIVTSNERNLLVDVPFGNGRIVYLSDPYVVSNGGIAMLDNAQLGINIVANGDGSIAFDEYHQGFGGNNRFFEFFAGTPVIAIFLQCAFLTMLVFFSRSRRFGRAVPEAEPNRLSKLEYVSAMAELQRRTGAFDLAIENIYRDFRRRAAKLVGVDNNSVSLKEFSGRIADRAQIDPRSVEDLFFVCDEIVYGEPTNQRKVLDAVRRIREIEYALALRKRQDKQ